MSDTQRSGDLSLNQGIDVPDGLIGRFALIEPWEAPKSAEHENIQRIIFAARQLGLECLVIDPDGYLVSDSRNRQYSRIDARDVDFVISLHFHTAKTTDAFSYGCLWSPPAHYFTWGYEEQARKLLTHDDFLDGGSPAVRRQISGLLASSRRNSVPRDLTPFYLSLSGPVIEPVLERFRAPKLFYTGINWERIDGGRGRFDELLTALDANAELEIYGPEVFHGVRTWEGYRSYRGSIPMDGVSTVRRAATCGVSLVLASEDHVDAGLMTNRLYESLAAGTLPIVSDNDFVRDHFGDSVLYVRHHRDQQLMYEQTMRHLEWIKENPEAAFDKAVNAQGIFESRFRLDKVIANLYARHPTRVALRNALVCARRSVEQVAVIVPILSRDAEAIERTIGNITCQQYGSLEVHFLIDDAPIENREEIELRILNRIPEARIHWREIFSRTSDWRESSERIMRRGMLIADLLPSVKADYLMLMDTSEQWMSMHVTTLKRVLEDDETVLAAYSGVIAELPDSPARHQRRLEYLLIEDQAPFVFATQFDHSGSFMFRRERAERQLGGPLEGLDGAEHTLLLLDAFVHGRIEASQLATFVHVADTVGRQEGQLAALPEQSQFIRDHFRFDRNYRDAVATLLRPRSFQYAFDTGAPLAAAVMRSPSASPARVSIDTEMTFGLAGSARQYQAFGWSTPEQAWTWIEGTRAGMVMELEDISQDLSFVLTASANVSHGAQWVALKVNGVCVGIVPMTRQVDHRLWFVVPQAILADGTTMEVSLEMKYSTQLSEFDPRSLSLCVKSFEVVSAPRSAVLPDGHSEEFDEGSYLEAYPDVKEAIGRGQFSSAREHYAKFGRSEGRNGIWIPSRAIRNADESDIDTHTSERPRRRWRFN